MFYCQIVETALHRLSSEPIINKHRLSSESILTAMRRLSSGVTPSDKGIKLRYNSATVGTVDFRINALELGSVSVHECEAEIEHHGATIALDLEGVTIDIKSFDFSYNQSSWPHDSGSHNMAGELSARLHIEVDTRSGSSQVRRETGQESEEEITFDVDSLHLKLASDADKWLHFANSWLTDHARSIVRETVQRRLANVVAEAWKLAKDNKAKEEAEEDSGQGKAASKVVV